MRGLLGLSLAGWASPGLGRGRMVPGGRCALRIPWPLGSIDPHRLDDAAAAILGDALFDTLYARDASGSIVPSLAEAEPEFDGTAVSFSLRAGLRTGRGAPLGPRDVLFSLARARAAGGRVWLADLPNPRVSKSTFTFAVDDPIRVVRALSSPLTAIVPSNFNPLSPDGTGPFRAEARGDGLALVRNPNAARGAGWLDEFVVRPAPDLASSLRAFESGADDVGWLGTGLHERRPGAETFDVGAVAWAVLRTGRDAGVWDSPGVAQSLANQVGAAKLASLGITGGWTEEKGDGWGGPSTSLLVRDDSPWLGELARILAALLGRSGRELSVRPVSAGELASRRSTRTYPLLLDLVRPFGPGPLATLAALSAANDPALADDLVKHPPRLADVPARALTRTLRLGVVGEVRVQGGRVRDLHLEAGSMGIDFGASHRTGARS